MLLEYLRVHKRYGVYKETSFIQACVTIVKLCVSTGQTELLEQFLGSEIQDYLPLAGRLRVDNVVGFFNPDHSQIGHQLFKVDFSQLLPAGGDQITPRSNQNPILVWPIFNLQLELKTLKAELFDRNFSDKKEEKANRRKSIRQSLCP